MMINKYIKGLSVFIVMLVFLVFNLEKVEAATTSMISDSFTVQMGSDTYSLNPLCAQTEVIVTWKCTIGSNVSLKIIGSDNTTPVSKTVASGETGTFIAKRGVTYTVRCMTSMTQYGPATVLVSCSYLINAHLYNMSFNGSYNNKYIMYLPANTPTPGTYTWGSGSKALNTIADLKTYSYPVKVKFNASISSVPSGYSVSVK